MLREYESMSAPALAVHAASSSGCGMLSNGRPWVQFEGFALKEGGSIAGGLHPRYLVVSGDRLEYFEEKRMRLELRIGETPAQLLSSLGLELDHTNVLLSPSLSLAPHKAAAAELQPGDVLIGINGEPVVNRSIAEMRRAVPGPITFSVLRPKGRIALGYGASVVQGARKHGGGQTLVVNDTSSRRSKYTFVVTDELCGGWVASIKEAIAAAAMDQIKSALSQALQLQALHQYAGRTAGIDGGGGSSSNSTGHVVHSATMPSGQPAHRSASDASLTSLLNRIELSSGRDSSSDRSYEV
jgi:hypothetical protein